MSKLYFTAYDAEGAPLAGLTPVWATILFVDGSAYGSSPSITSLGNGIYEVAEVPGNVTGIIDLGASATPRYLHVRATEAETFAGFDTAGAPLAGLTPTWVTLLKTSDGTAQTQPVIAEVGGGIYSFDFSGESSVGVIDLGAGAEPRYLDWHGPVFSSSAALEKIMAKNQFVSTEPLRVIFYPFVNKSTGEIITAGDTVTLAVKKPDGAVYSTPVPLTRDPDTFFWVGEIPVEDYQEGDWLVMASSDNPDAQKQFRIISWGGYVNSIPTASSEATAAKVAAQATQTDVGDIKKVQVGRWKVQGTQLIMYELDGTTIYKVFDLKDDTGSPSGIRIFERVPA